MNKHVPTIQTCQRLAEHVTMETEFYWAIDLMGGDETSLEYGDKPEDHYSWKFAPAPLLSELLAVMPYYVYEKQIEYRFILESYEGLDRFIVGYKNDDGWVCCKNPNNNYGSIETATNKVLLWLLEQGHVYADELSANN